MRVFEEAAIDKMAPLVEDYLRQHHAPHVEPLSADLLRLRVKTAIRRAMEYGLDGDAFGLLISLMFEIAPNVDAHPAFHEILSDRTLDSDLRYQLLVEGITRRDIDEARAMADEAAWNDPSETR